MDQKIYALLDADDIEPPASEAALEALAEYVRVTFGTRLPDDYPDLLRATDGYNGYVGGKAYVVLWPAAVVPRHNEGYESQKFMPGYLMIGSDSGPAVFGLDLRGPAPEAADYVEAAFVPMSWEDTFGRDASLYDFLQRRIAQHDEDGDGDGEDQ